VSGRLSAAKFTIKSTIIGHDLQHGRHSCQALCVGLTELLSYSAGYSLGNVISCPLFAT
jgi:hypothetical protein